MPDERLSLAAALYQPCGLGADIGTDHALLPCHLLEQGVCERMILTDLSEKALAHARREVDKRGLADRISLRCGDGLSVIDEPCGCISVTGMGGRTIAGILSRGRDRLCGAALVVCAHTEQDEVRRCFRRIGYRIVREEPCVCSGHAYVIWRAEPGEMRLTPLEEATGRELFASDPSRLIPYLRMRLDVLDKRLRGLRSAREPDPEAIAWQMAQYERYREVLDRESP